MAKLLGAHDYSVSRLAPGDYVDGEWVDGAETTFTIRGSVQPLSEREREDLPEGIRQRARWYFYTRGELQIDDVETGATTGLRGDVITYKGLQLEAVGVEDWADHVAPTRHRQYLLALVGKDEVR